MQSLVSNMKHLIKKMPTKELLEDFILHMDGKGDGTYFDTKKGEFINSGKNKDYNTSFESEAKYY